MKDMKEMIAKLGRIVQELYDEKLSLNLFALFLREGNEKWDLLVSSEWIDRDRYGSLKHIESKLKKELSQEELLEIAGMVVIDDMSIIDDINRAIYKYPCGVAPPGVEKENIYLNGIIIRYGYIIISNNLRTSLVLA